MTYSLVHVRIADTRLDADALARAAGIHPQLLDRLVALGLIEPLYDPRGRAWFAAADASRIGRIQRLRAGLGLNYAAIGLVLDLLDRLAAAHTTARAVRHSGG